MKNRSTIDKILAQARLSPCYFGARISCAVLLLSLTTCQVAIPERELSWARTSGRPIYYGNPDTAPSHSAVVALTQGPGTGYFCSGTLIADDVVLTAAHCLEGVKNANEN